MSYRPLIFRAAPFVATIGLAYAGGYLYKDWTIPRFESDESLEGKTVVITGATKGLGRATAKEFAKRNARVILGCKDQDKCIGVRRKIVDSTSNSEVYCSVLDMSSIKSIQEFIRRLDDKKIGVDILINNAAVKSVTLRSTREGFEKQLGVNYLGHFYLTYALMDNLLKNAPSRIVNVVCPNYRKGKINFEDLNSKNSFDYDKAYNQSKLAMALFTKELSDRLKKTNVFVYSADPGLCRTDLNREMRYRKSMIAKIFVSPILWFFERSPFHGSQVILHCALSPDLANQEAAGLYYKNNQPQTTEEILDDKALAKKLWLVSEKWTVHRVKPLPPTSAQDSQSKDSDSSKKDEKNS